MPHYFIAGTDTDVGKTYVTCCLLRELTAQGKRAVGYKPIACGDRADARAIRDACASKLSLEQINPLYLRSATAPYIASELEQINIDTDALLSGYEQLCEGHDIVLVEGAGGWHVPMKTGYTMGDFAQQLGLPVILVAENKLGVINHTILTVNAIKAQGLECIGIILNHRAEEWDLASLTNRRQIEEFCGVPVLAELISGQEDIEVDFIS